MRQPTGGVMSVLATPTFKASSVKPLLVRAKETAKKNTNAVRFIRKLAGDMNSVQCATRSHGRHLSRAGPVRLRDRSSCGRRLLGRPGIARSSRGTAHALEML